MGHKAGEPFLLAPFWRRITSDLYGTFLPSGLRRYRNGLIFLPRKNAKTTWCAGTALKLTFDGEQGGAVVVAANSKDEAGKLWKIAADMVEGSPILKPPRANINYSNRIITDTHSNSTLRPISAEVRTNYSWDLSGWIYDEYHQATNSDLYDALFRAVGARQQPLGLVITTAGHDKQSPLGELYDYAKMVLEDPEKDPNFYAYIAEASADDPWDDERTWEKANPGIDVIRNREEMRISARSAKYKPSEVSAFQRFYLNIWTQSEDGYIPLDAWDDCNAQMPEAELTGVQCYGGLDLSATTDLTAFELLFPVGDKIYRRGWVWIPEANLEERERRAGQPLLFWAKKLGLIEILPGEVIDPGYVTAKIIELSKQYNIQRITFDRWGAAGVYKDLENAGLTVVQFGQGFASMSAPTKELLNAVLTRRLAHGGDPLLRWQASCCSALYDPAGNVKLAKPKRSSHTKKIDSMVALVMALDGVMRAEPPSKGLFSEAWWETPA